MSESRLGFGRKRKTRVSTERHQIMLEEGKTPFLQHKGRIRQQHTILKKKQNKFAFRNFFLKLLEKAKLVM